MKALASANTVRLNCKIRADIKAALEEVAARKHREEGGYVGLTRVVNQAGLLLLEQEGITIDPEAKPLPQPVRKPAKSDTRRRRAVAVRA